MTRIRRKTVASLAPLVALAVLLLFAQGCAAIKPDTKAQTKRSDTQKKSTTTLDSSAEALGVKPTQEMARFYRAIKNAERVIFIKDPIDPDTDDRDLEPLRVYHPYERAYWDVTGAVTSAKNDEKLSRHDSGARYLLRWYKNYKKLGEVLIDTGTGAIEVRYPVAKQGNKKVTNRFYTTKEKLDAIEDAVKEEKPDTPSGRLI